MISQAAMDSYITTSLQESVEATTTTHEKFPDRIAALILEYADRHVVREIVEETAQALVPKKTSLTPEEYSNAQKKVEAAAKTLSSINPQTLDECFLLQANLQAVTQADELLSAKLHNHAKNLMSIDHKEPKEE